MITFSSSATSIPALCLCKFCAFPTFPMRSVRVGGGFWLVFFGLGVTGWKMLMLRSIADIAWREGHDLSDIRTKLFCLEVFALGGRTDRTGSGERSSYWAVRAALSKAISE